MPEKKVGEVTHYFGKIQVAVIKATGEAIKKGQQLHFVGHGADFQQEVTSLQIDHSEVAEISVGQEGGMKVDQAAKESTEIYLAEE